MDYHTSIANSDDLSSTQFFASARTALKIAFHQLNFPRGGRVFVPDFICDVLLHPILQTDLMPVYYPVTQDLVPNWEELETRAANADCQALIMVHYFGQPQNIEQFRSFCSRYQLLLMEDNAHGYGGMLNGRPLGSFGDIGISSPRKLLGTPSGGVLHGANTISLDTFKKMKPFPAYRPSSLLRATLNSVPRARRVIKGIVDRNKDWSDPNLYRESVQRDFGIDRYSHWRITTTDWKVMAQRRRENWTTWDAFAKRKGLQPVFSEVHPESCPWAMPAYASDMAERNSWLDWGARNRVPLFPWPTLPKEIISGNGEAFRRWGKMVCFPLEVSVNEMGY